MIFYKADIAYIYVHVKLDDDFSTNIFNILFYKRYIM